MDSIVVQAAIASHAIPEKEKRFSGLRVRMSAAADSDRLVNVIKVSKGFKRKNPGVINLLVGVCPDEMTKSDFSSFIDDLPGGQPGGTVVSSSSRELNKFFSFYRHSWRKCGLDAN